MRELAHIAGIPVAEVVNHNEAVYFWQKWEIEDATALHVDAHPDIKHACPPIEALALVDVLDYYKYLSIANFLCASIHHEIIKTLYWFNPHSRDFRLKFMGSTGDPHSCPSIKTKVVKERNSPRQYICWENELNSITRFGGSFANVVWRENPEFSNPFLLDIDLDGFCCNNRIHNPPDRRYCGVSDFEERIHMLIDLLEVSSKPDGITIARSVVPGDERVTFMPVEMVDQVQEYLLICLRRVYGDNLEWTAVET